MDCNGAKVLVVDDEPLVLELTLEALQELGCEIIPANSAAEAVRKLKQTPSIDLLITDINMPGMSGYELAATAKQLYPDLKVILLSGRETASRGLLMIHKPFTQRDIARAIETS
jgi:CheY-like chemotaxis protein